MKRKVFYLVLILILSISCKNSSQKRNNLEKSDVANLTSTQYKTKSGKIFIVRVDHSMGESTCNVEIESQGFLGSNSVHKLGIIDKLEKVFLADLDSNGFEEIYLITRSAGSGSYSNIYGIASNKDKSTSPIYVPPISEKELEKGGPFEGFMGHNQFSLNDNKLINSFPIFLKGNTNSNPQGGQRNVEYQLVAGEASWILSAKSVKD